ncbi:MAG: hypothetical protein QE274_13070 [Verrucomicrobiaceae bacterium]|jgi:hypothetical protein|nr:hypothetical protein [Verrucomicrobiaceae bacterium]
MKAIIEHLIVAVIAVGMALVGYWLIGWYRDGSTSHPLVEWKDPGWVVWSSTASIATWFILYRICRLLHWHVLPIMGVLSPLIGGILFFIPYTLLPWMIIFGCAPVVFPVGIATGLLISIATLPFRPREVLWRNVDASPATD